MRHCRNSLCGRESSLRAVNENPPIEPVGHLARPTDGLTDPRWIYALNRPDMLFDRIGAVQPSLDADHARETQGPPESLGLSRVHPRLLGDGLVPRRAFRDVLYRVVEALP
jgi:hypothetical protein